MIALERGDPKGVPMSSKELAMEFIVMTDPE
jgi:hypothetical protein